MRNKAITMALCLCKTDDRLNNAKVIDQRCNGVHQRCSSLMQWCARRSAFKKLTMRVCAANYHRCNHHVSGCVVKVSLLLHLRCLTRHRRCQVTRCMTTLSFACIFDATQHLRCIGVSVYW